jgi:hypothetical protein
MISSPVSSRGAAYAVALGALALCASAHAQTKPAPSAPPSSDLNESNILGQEPTGPSKPAPRGLDGHPDLTGYWKPIRVKGKPGGNIGKDEPGFKLPFTPAGEAALQYNLTKTVDPEAVCILGGIPRHNASGLPFEILHTPQRLATLYVYNTHRWVWIDGRAPDPDPEPRYFGNAVGHWDGDTLVVESNGFKDSKDGKLWIDEKRQSPEREDQGGGALEPSGFRSHPSGYDDQRSRLLHTPVHVQPHLGARQDGRRPDRVRLQREQHRRGTHRARSRPDRSRRQSRRRL